MKGISGILLAGGKSSRMGRDKAMLTFQGMSLLEWQVRKLQTLGIEDIILSGHCPALDGTRAVADEYPNRGPLGGMHACMKQAENPDCLILSVDVPLVPAQALAGLAEAHRKSGAAVTLLQHGEKWEPLIGVYKRGLFQPIERILQGEHTAVRRLLEEVGFQTVTWPEDALLFCNCNTPQDYEKLRRAAPRSIGQ